jgi:hypothetical protein
MQVFRRPRKQYSNWLLWWCPRQRFGYSVLPELHAHHANGGCACCVSDAGDFNIEGADSDVCIARGQGYEGLEDMRGCIVGSECTLVLIQRRCGTHYLTRFAQYALARSTSASEGRAASLRHCVAWNCLRWSTGLVYSRRVGAAKDVGRRIEVLWQGFYGAGNKAMAILGALNTGISAT